MNEPILTADNVFRTFSVPDGAFGKAATLTAVSGVSLQVLPQMAIGIAGESGCGKSTLAKLLTGLIPPTSGSINYRGRSLASMSPVELQSFRRSVQMVFQDPYSSLNPRMRVGQIVGEPLLIHKLANRRTINSDVLRLLDAVGLPAESAQRYPHEFSGGQRQRIGIARALALNPKILIADEPVSALDLSIQAQIINLLQELRDRYDLALVLIAHDLSVIRHLCDTVAIMYLGEIVEYGPCADLFQNTRHPYTQALLAAIPQLNRPVNQQRVVLTGDLPSPVNPPPGCRFHTRCPYAAEICRQTAPPLAPCAPNHLTACHLSDKIFA